MMSDHFFGTELLLFPFWCLDAKGEKNISMSSFLFGFDL
jgi:hypothetical protein